MSHVTDRNRRLLQVLATLDQRMRDAAQVPPCEDAVPIRIVGEFSSGKTRLIRELLRGHVPDALLPYSSLQPETAVPLEVTHGLVPRLTLVQRCSDRDVDTKSLTELEAFPTREEVLHSSENRRLRLEAPLPSLLCARDGEPSRVILIDTPGWNASADASALQQNLAALEDMCPPALIYVSRLDRLQRAGNDGAIDEMLDAIRGSLATGSFHFIVVVTNAAEVTASAQGVIDDFVERLRGRSVDVLGDELALVIDAITVDFDRPSDRERFCDKFWRRLEAITGGHVPLPQPPLDAMVRAWALGSHVRGMRALVRGLQRWHEALLHGPLAHKVNWVVLEAHSAARRREMVRRAFEDHHWPDGSAPMLDVRPPRLNAGHPLAEWWNEILVADITAAATELSRAWEAQLANVSQPAVGTTLEDHLRTAIAAPLHRAERTLQTACAYFPECLDAHIDGDVDALPVIATMLAVSIGIGAVDEMSAMLRLDAAMHGANAGTAPACV